MEINHTFAICAYKESDYLEECINSLLNQTIKHKVIICTSTPNKYIEDLAEKYKLELFINPNRDCVSEDFNFALSKIKTKYGTLANQDDIYLAEFGEMLIMNMEKKLNSLIGFCQSIEFNNEKELEKTLALKIKHFMNMFIYIFPKSKFIRNRVLSLGCSIVAPSVMYNMQNINKLKIKFSKEFELTPDWDFWTRLSNENGSYVYVKNSLIKYRVHDESNTSKRIKRRHKEELQIFNRYYPNWVAKFIHKFYKKATINRKKNKMEEI